MRICFVYEGLFPGSSRAARHVEAMARRFAAKGHGVSVVTTSFPGSKDPEELLVVRLPHAPEGPSDKDEHLFQKTIVRHLKTAGADVMFAESLTPLSTIAVKAAGECHVPTIVRVLSDRDGIMHEFGGRRSNQKLVRKKIIALLEHATVAAVTSDHCRELLAEYWTGPTQVIEKCVDLNVFRLGRTTRRDMEKFLERHDAGGRRILLYARERLRQSTPAEVLPLLAHLRKHVPDVVLMLVGELEGSGLLEAAAEMGVGDLVRATGPVELRDFFAAYEAASVFLVPPQSRASAREILEAMAMGCAVACFEETAAASAPVVVPDETGIVLPSGRWEEAALRLASLLADEGRLQALQDGSLAMARRHDLMVAIEKVEKLCEQVLGRSVAPEPAAARVARRPLEEAREKGGGDDRRGGRGEEGIESGAGAEVPASSLEAGMNGRDDEHEDGEAGGGVTGEGRSEAGGEAGSAGAAPPPASPDPGGPPPEDKPPQEVVWTEDDADETLRFDPDSEEGFERVDSDEEARPPREDEPRPGDRGRDRDRRGRGRGRGRGRSGPDVQEIGSGSGIDVLDIGPERRDRRRWALEPGLTLKDLLPFLRPPKTVLILGASTGNGHNRTAAAIAEAFKGLDRNLIVREADILELTEKTYRSSYVRTLLEDLSRNPAIFGAPFETLDAAADAGLPAELEELVGKAFGERMDQLVVDRRPDHIVATHWLPFRHFEALKEQQKLTASLTAVIPEPDLHVRWISPVIGHYLVVNETVKARLQKKGVDPSAITVTGTPVSPAYGQPADREQIARELAIRTQLPTVLLRPGGIGSTERILAVAGQIMEAIGTVNLLVVAGKNERLKEEVAKLDGTRGSTVRSFGFVDNIRDLMMVSDVLITRASPHTVAEACAAALPMILLRPSPGVEDRVADRMLAAGIAQKVYGEDDLDHVVRELFRNRRQLQQMQEAARGERRVDAALGAAERIARIVK